MSNLTAAMQHVRAGMHVFPVQPLEKTPIVKPDGRRMRWGIEATNDPRIVEDWWTYRCPIANIGVACKPSRLLIVDCDMPKPGAKLPKRFGDVEDYADGQEVFYVICQELGVPFPHDTLTISSPSGGAHFYFRNELDVPLRQTSPVPGWIDVRGNGGEHGGYVLGKGSQLPNGEYKLLNRSAIRPAPDWLIALCQEPPAPPAPAPRQQPFRGDGQGGRLDGLINSVRGAVEGNRNASLHWAACKYAEEGEPISRAIADLGQAALEAGLSRGEIEPTIRSGYRTQGR